MDSSEQDRQKKRRLARDGEYANTSKPTSSFRPAGGRHWTISVAIPGSILSTSCGRDDQRAAVVSRVARAAAVFGVDEIVVYDDSPAGSRPRAVDPAAYAGDVDPCGYIEHLLRYLEAPPFMRRVLFPVHPNLRGAGVLIGLDIPSHPHPSGRLPYCEGITTAGTLPPSGSDAATAGASSGDGGGDGRKKRKHPKEAEKNYTLVDVGGKSPVVLAGHNIAPNTRVTLHLNPDDPLRGELVAPGAPREDGGYYWGFSVRRCASLSAIFEGCAFDGGYDLSIGTSERGQPVSEAFPDTPKKKKGSEFSHLLVVFGGPRGIEYAAENDAQLQDMGIVRGKTKELFDHWVNILPGQDSRSIRTEEALLIGLTSLRRLWEGGQ
ncbi:DUF171-domain-containing protein [Durotheca rogersii]|uniref:DUF171-domain-containing protein n=1 Tax=Durotheca rogersii TaxID=419775 RepID=UPI00221F5781|nr:DUF171-domain-containing protein [Durotheca rogersii]KAI5867559.1 DUF171-domain-containing protein [Durotheca rogersii]